MKHVKSLSSLTLIAVLGVSMSACGGTPTASPTAPSAEPITPVATATSAAPALKKSPRGNIIKALGEPGGQTDGKTGKQVIAFTINKITADAPCTGKYPQTAQNGHFVVLDVVAETMPELAQATWTHFDMNATSFQFVGANGTTYNGSLGTGPAFSCLADSEQFPLAGMGPAEKVNARIALDVPETSGTLVFKSVGSSSGWEYTF